jgi:hypothetical protein
MEVAARHIEQRAHAQALKKQRQGAPERFCLFMTRARPRHGLAAKRGIARVDALERRSPHLFVSLRLVSVEREP